MAISMATNGLFRPGHSSCPPELAQTNLMPTTGLTLPQGGRRTTCEQCRDRKVRCDRTKPECGRCKKGGKLRSSRTLYSVSLLPIIQPPGRIPLSLSVNRERYILFIIHCANILLIGHRCTYSSASNDSRKIDTALQNLHARLSE